MERAKIQKVFSSADQLENQKYLDFFKIIFISIFDLKMTDRTIKELMDSSK